MTEKCINYEKDSVIVIHHGKIAEAVAKKLFKFEYCSKEDQKKMISRACRAAQKLHEHEIKKIKEDYQFKIDMLLQHKDPF